jgi:hypothetical protein
MTTLPPRRRLAALPRYPAHLTRYGADISQFAGQTAVLRITAPGVYGTIPPNGLLLDNIVFSPAAVPEPDPGATLGASLLAFWLLACRRASRTSAKPLL